MLQDQKETQTPQSKEANQGPFRGRLKWAVLVTFLTIAPSMAQTAKEFQQRYGVPDDKGRYIVRPGIALIASFAEDGQPCKLQIESQYSEPTRGALHPLMPAEAITELIDEIAPISQRGWRGRSISLSGGCTSVHGTDYEQVMITRTILCKSDGGSGIWYANIHWKRQECK